MILLSENKDYQYLGIEAPKYAEDIRKVWDGISWEEEYRTIGVPIKGEFEILGVIGNGSEITEEVAMEILQRDPLSGNWKDYTHRDIYHKVCYFDNYKDSFNSLIQHYGIQIENPIPYPGNNIDGDNIDQHIEWQDSEDKTVKLVIIKVKK